MATKSEQKSLCGTHLARSQLTHLYLARRCKHMHCQKLTQTYSKVPPLEYSLLGKRTQTLSQDLLWTITPSANPTHTVRQHNGPSYSHSDIQLTLLNGNNAREGDDPLTFIQLPIGSLCSSAPAIFSSNVSSIRMQSGEKGLFKI